MSKEFPGGPSVATINPGTLAELNANISDANLVPEVRTITATTPITIAGTTSADLSANRTIAIPAATNAAAGHATAAQITTLEAALVDADFAGTATGPLVRTGTAAYAVQRNNSAASAPGATNDVGEGYRIGSIWIDTTGPDVYMATTVTDGAAVWVLLYSAP